MQPPFNAALHDRAEQGMRLQPVSMDGLTHFCVVVDDPYKGQITAPKCGSRLGTRLANFWELVNCPECRATPNTAS